jgi:hypothetical protein
MVFYKILTAKVICYQITRLRETLQTLIIGTYQIPNNGIVSIKTIKLHRFLKLKTFKLEINSKQTYS